MPSSTVSFQNLSPEFQNVIHLAEERNRMIVSPLQELGGGWSGASVYLVRAAMSESGDVEHLILKLDHKRPMASSDEIARHRAALRVSPPEFAQQHIPDMAFDRVEAGDALGIFYTIAGHSLLNVRTLSSFGRQKRLEALFSATGHMVLDEWNRDHTIENIAHPSDLLRRWLGFRLEKGQRIEAFIQELDRGHPGRTGFILDGDIYPNPLRYARQTEGWGDVREFDAAIGLHHGDLNTNNVLARFSRHGLDLEDFYLIDFCLFKESMPLFFDLRYLEMSYLAHAIERVAPESVLRLISGFGGRGARSEEDGPIEMAGVNAILRAGTIAFEDWLESNHPSLQDDLWGQYWLAGTAAGLSFCHKAGQPRDIRLAGLVFAAANLRAYFDLHGVPLPPRASQLLPGGGLEEAGQTGVALDATASAATMALPAPLTSFIGRQAELADLRETLLSPEVRLVTLTGPGGTGKTALALEAGRGLIDQFADGAAFVDLAQVADPELVASTIAHSLGIREGGGQASIETLGGYLQSRDLLLILDNLEQIVGAGQDLSTLLADAPSLTMLLTSRIPIHIRGEHEFPVSPLPTPPSGPLAIEEALAYPSVALFRRRAQTVRPGFELDQTNLKTVVEICRRLDGLPLALELAAARIKLLTPEALLNRLDHTLDLLVGRVQDVPDRQKTIRGTIDWSYDLLDDSSRAVFVRLGVFSGGFTLEAAEAICDPMGASEVFSGVESLLDNNLLRRVDSVDDEPRLEMLQTIREYALERASGEGILDDLRRAHSWYFMQLAGTKQGAGVYGSESGFWLKRYEEEHDNFRLALQWAYEHQEESLPAAIALLSQLSWFWYRHGYLQEGTEWMERVLEATEGMGDSMVRAFSLAGRALLALWSGDLLVAETMGKLSLEMSEWLRLDEVSPLAKLAYGVTLINQGRHTTAYPQLVDAVELFDEQESIWYKGTTLVHLANVSLGMGNPAEALQFLDSAMPLLRETGDVWNMAFGMNNYGEVARVQGDYERAQECYRQTEALFEQADAKGDQARLIHSLAYIAMHNGDHAGARSQFLKSLQEFLKLGNHRGVSECLAGLAVLAVQGGDHEWAVPLLSSAERQLGEIRGAWWPADQVEIDRAKAAMTKALADRFEGLWERGQLLSTDEAIAYAQTAV